MSLLPLLVLLAAPAAAQDDQPAAAPQEFSNGQENGFGRIAMEPYLPADGQARTIEARIELRDVAVLERTTRLLVAFNRLSRDVVVTGETLVAGGRTLGPIGEDTAEGGLQRQLFFDPAQVAAQARDGRVEMRFTGQAEAQANGQWHVGALVLAFDSTWATVRSADGGDAVLYGFTLLMATGLSGTALAPFHGLGNERVFLVPLAVAAIGVLAGGWRLARETQAWVIARAAGPQPAGPTVPPLATATTVVRAPRRKARSDLWTMDFGYRLEAQPVADPAQPVLAFEMEAAATAAPGPLGAVQGPKLPAGLAPGPWRATVLRDGPATAPRRPARPPAGNKRPAAASSRAKTPRGAAAPSSRRAPARRQASR